MSDNSTSSQLQRYEDILDIALSHHNVELLIKLWHDSMLLDKTSLSNINKRIIELLPRFEKFYDLEPSTNMKDFVEKYYNSFCDEGPDFCIGHYAAQGDLKRVKQQITRSPSDLRIGEKGATNLGYAMEQAAANAKENVVRFLVEIGCKKYSRGLEGTLNGLSKTDTEELREKRRRLVYYFMARKSTEGTRNGLVKSLMVNDAELISLFREYFEETDLTEYEYVYAAAFGGNKEFIEEILSYYDEDEDSEQRADILDKVSEGAYDGGNEELEAWAIEMGGNPSPLKETIQGIIDGNLDNITIELYNKIVDTKNLELIRQLYEQFKPFPSSLRKAGQLGDIKIIQILTQKSDKKRWTNVLEGAAATGRLSIIRLCLDNGAEITEKALLEAVSGGFKDVVEYFLEHQKFDLEVLEDSVIIAENKEDSAMTDYLIEVAESLFPDEFEH